MADDDRRIPSLDGVRAISILLVVTDHLATRLQLPLLWRFDVGNLGVRAFFVISGFLITTLLLREHEKTGTISLRLFYLRRAFRILPAYYVFLATMAVLVLIGYEKGTFAEFLPALLYISNYKLPFHDLRHTWSLSVEEQFYLLWPAAIVIMGLRRATWGCALLLLVAPLFRLLFDLGHWHVIYEAFAFECVCDALAAGCLLATFRGQLWRTTLYRRMVGSPFLWGLPLAALALLAVQPPPIVQDLICIPILNLSIAMLIDRYMRLPAATTVGRLLNFAPVVWIGTISYSLYLWQMPIMFSGLIIPLKMFFAFACAAGSYYFVERPFLRIRSRIAGLLFGLPPRVKIASSAAG